MKASVDPTLRNLNDCGCCEGLSVQTPMEVFNRPGLKAIAYRIGMHSQFKQSLLARLSTSKQPALRRLSTRDDDDFTIALLDSWATVADVLTFYQEHIANESYLRTATERLSLQELARLIGYELRSGVAASTYLAFTLEDAPGAFGQALSVSTTAQSVPEPLPRITIDIGTKVQSIPGPEEQAQTFETIEKIEARAEWNTIKPRLRKPQILSVDLDSVFLQGTATELKQGDIVLIVDDSGGHEPRKVLNVSLDEEAKTTRIDYKIPRPSPQSYERHSSLPEGSISDFTTEVELDESVIEDIISKTWKEEDLSALIKIQNWSAEELVANIAKQTAIRTLAADTGVFAFRQRASVFGYNATKQVVYDGTEPKPAKDWEEWTLADDEEGNIIYLDRANEAILPGSYIAIKKPGQEISIFQIEKIETRPRTAYGLSSETTVITLPPGQNWWKPSTEKDRYYYLAQKRKIIKKQDNLFQIIRKTAVYAQSEQLTLADVPIEDFVEGDTVTLDQTYLGLEIGQKVMLTGERSDLKGVTAGEMMTLKEVIIEKGFTVLTFDKSLAYSYMRNTVTINANVALATHGETVEEILGSGDASQSFQRFTLRQPPLTYISATTPSGTETTLEVRVNDLLWQEVPTFYGHGSEERIYVTRTDDEGKTSVMFGDGKTGARLPTGQENVKAKYRKGIGLSGLVKANQLSQLMTRPLGVKGAINLAASSGAADRESLAEARRNAPLTILTLDRIVSLQDYEDFARAFAGIDKSLATWIWNGQKRSVFVTVAGSKGAIVKRDSTLYRNLLRAMRKAGDPNVNLSIESYKPRFFRLTAKIQVKSDYLEEKVLPEVEQKLRESFSFNAREFGQPVTLSEVISVIQNIPGMEAVDVDELYYSDETVDLNAHLEAALPRPGGDKVFAAELLTLDPRPIGFEVMS